MRREKSFLLSRFFVWGCKDKRLFELANFFFEPRKNGEELFPFQPARRPFLKAECKGRKPIRFLQKNSAFFFPLNALLKAFFANGFLSEPEKNFDELFPFLRRPKGRFQKRSAKVRRPFVLHKRNRFFSLRITAYQSRLPLLSFNKKTRENR